jgi:Tol biopolymer transport system component
VSDDRWRRIEKLCHDALKRDSGDRAAFVREACGDDELLRREVESFLVNASLSKDSRLGIGDLGLDPIGRQIGIYQIVSLLGAGGMGEVYRARDTKLGRDVAIKILPKLFTSDPDRLARFEREARVLASLNHPHIGAIYGLEDADGVRALVLELVAGETLADRIARGPIPLTDALTIARQIVDALDAAHEKGVIHRDLKPANIKITPEGVVKVLDFGLAKAAVGDGATPDLSQSPTMTVGGTREGVILGTAAYMSPEQARGLAVDKRTDIWAFGCVLYEMLSGRCAFSAETVSDTIAAVLAREPDWNNLPPTLPSMLRSLLKKCLAKDVRHRLRDVSDAGLYLEDVLAPAVHETIAKRARGHVWRTAMAALGSIAIGAGAVAMWGLSRSPGISEQGVVRYSINLPLGEEFESQVAGLPIVMAISPDGRQIVYSGRSPLGNRLYRRGRDEFASTAVQGTDGGFGPFFSPDGQWIGFVAGGMLQKVPLAGGRPQVIAAAANVFGASWGAGDTIVWSEWNKGLFRVSANGGTPEPLTKVDEGRGEIQHFFPKFSPDGGRVFFSVQHRDAPRAVEVMELATRRRQLLVAGEGAYLSQGQLVFSRGSTVFAAPFDIDRLALARQGVRVLDGVSAASGQPQFAVASDGTLVYVPSPSNARRLVWMDRRGTRTPVIEDAQRFSHPRISPEGDRVLVQVVSDSGGNEFWIYDVRRGTRTRLGARGSRPIWESNGMRVTFQSNSSLYSMPADSSREPELLVAREKPGPLFPLAWSADGLVLVFSRAAPETNRDIFTMRRGETPRAFVDTPRDERAAMLSPDGHWMVCAVRDIGREEEIYVQPYPAGDSRIVVSAGGGVEPVWSPTGREIFYRSTDGRKILAVDVTTQPTFRAGTPRTLFEGHFPVGTSFWTDYDVSRDGNRFLMLEAADESNSQMNVVVNWMDALRASPPVSVKQ